MTTWRLHRKVLCGITQSRVLAGSCTDDSATWSREINKVCGIEGGGRSHTVYLTKEHKVSAKHT
jgi:hypothetical protein